MEKENKKIVMFDFDGVIINTLEFSYQIHKINNKDLTWERFQDFSNGNFHDGFERALKEENFISIGNFYDHYDKNLIKLNIHEVIQNALLFLASKYKLVIISSTHATQICNFLKKENILECFEDVLGHDTHKSKVVKIKSVLVKYDAKPDDCVFITDTLGDIKEANECNVPSIGVTWGLHAHAKLSEGNPVSIIDDPMNLVSAIQNVLK